MRGFDVLDPHLPLLDNHFLEASAGTGKTFAIEQVVVRLVQQGIPLDQILVVTFTRAATLDLKIRIQKQLAQLPQGTTSCDTIKIWTIHSFCFQMLRNYPLLTGFLANREEETTPEGGLIRSIKDYLRTEAPLSPKQLAKVLKGNPDALITQLHALVTQRLPIEQPDWAYDAELKTLAYVAPDKLLEDLLAQAPGYAGLCNARREVKPEVAAGLARFVALFSGEERDPVDLPILKFVPENQLKKLPTPTLHYPTFLAEAQRSLIPKLATFSDSRAILAHLAEKVRLHIEQVGQAEEWLFYEDLLRLMAQQVEQPAFAQQVRQAFRAVLIDEFQDTDPLQWKIFSTLFLDDAFHGPLYLVGDPKQSIYRFRNADLYTYCAAKRAMGEQSHASLQTNYRSTPALVAALNRLFANESLTLPKTGEVLPYPSVAAASTLPPLSDGKGALHYLIAENEAQLFATILHEIARLQDTEKVPLSACAVLVRDQFQAERFLATTSLPVAIKKTRSLHDSPAFPVLRALLYTVCHPNDRSAQVQLLAGPLFRYPLEAIPEAYDTLFRYQQLLQSSGLLALFEQVIADAPTCESALYHDLLQLVELGAPLRDGHLAFYDALSRQPTETEALRARSLGDREAVALMTIHMSKGLEFAVVFPVGLITSPPRRASLVRSGEQLLLSDPLHEQEEASERKRMTYVACTRAKQRLYFPIITSQGLEPITGEGISSEICQAYPPPHYHPPRPPAAPPALPTRSYPPENLHSFSSLYPHLRETESGATAPRPPSADDVPAGRETGQLIHKLLERLPLEKAFARPSLLSLIAPELRHTFLAPWTEVITGWIEKALHHPLPDPDGPFPLAAVNPKKILRETAFCFPSDAPRGLMKGYIDCFFEHNGHYYILDWKTHAEEAAVETLMSHYQYEAQGHLYRTAMDRYTKLFDCHNKTIKAVFFFFLRTQKIYSLLTKV